MRLSSYLCLLPLAAAAAAASPFPFPSLPELARSVSYGARSALQHSHSLISSTAHYLGHRKSSPGAAGGKRLKRQQTCVVRGVQYPLGAGGGGKGNATAPAGESATSPAEAGGTSKAAAVGAGPSSAGGSAPSQSAAASPSPSGGSSPPSSSAAPAASSPSPAASSAGWNLVQTYAGESFFSGWDFFAAADPTDGSVTYVSQSAAQSLSLISASAQSAIMRVSTAQPLPAGYANRPSVRITTQRTFTGGLLIGDIKHMPVGCGTWPAFWSNGPNWPAGGEIDIIEGVADATHNTASIHTNPGCTIPYDYGASGTPALAGQEGYNCAAAETGDSGCGLTDTTPNNYGTPFNNAGGGVFAMKWDSSGIAVYFWSRANVPSDITSSTPDPSGWPEPIGAWPASQCNPYEYFYNNVAIFDTTLCGQWAGNAWSSAAYGASQSCAQSTGYTTCDAYVAAQGGAFSDAYWEVYSVKLYQQAGMGA